ncbi:MAG: FtsW/RodA/SpoVE family cell cycle protein [Planctomycetota bacterium]|nr:FtsW/RodA/SpoVE family cell cycle protein [Planctomycetota bacterium]
MKAFANLRHVNWWLFLATFVLGLMSLVILRSTTLDDPNFGHQFGKQTLFMVIALGAGFLGLLPHYMHVRRAAWPIYAVAVLALVGLPLFGSVINGARRWYALPGFSIQPSEFAKLAVIIGLAALLRFEGRSQRLSGMIGPAVLVGLPAGLILLQPDLGSALVFGPVLLAMCYVAGTSGRAIALGLLLALAGLLLAYFTTMHGYQRERVDVWASHWGWDESSREVREVLRGPAYQPWQALIALGSGGLTGFGLGRGPQNRYAFLPYRSEDYVLAVVGEELGWLGCLGIMACYAVLVFGLLLTARSTRDRFGKLVCVGVATWIGCQSLIHAAVCGWLVPSTGLPMPMLSYGGSSVLATVLAIMLCLNIGSRREPVLAGDGYR